MFKKIFIGTVLTSLALISAKAVDGKEITDNNKTNMYIGPKLGNSNEDAKSASYGVYVDTSLWEVRWNNNYQTLTTWNEDIFGITDIHIGEAFYKKKIDGQYRTAMIFALKTMPRDCTIKKESGMWWWKTTSYETEYGCLKSIRVKSEIQENTASVIDSYPKYQANSTSYSIGVSFGVDSSGPNFSINASTSYTENALEITNRTNSSKKVIDIEIARNPKCDNQDTKKQMQQENWFYFRYDTLNDQKYLHQQINIDLCYQTISSSYEVQRTSTHTWGLKFA